MSLTPFSNSALETIAAIETFTSETFEEVALKRHFTIFGVDVSIQEIAGLALIFSGIGMCFYGATKKSVEEKSLDLKEKIALGKIEQIGKLQQELAELEKSI